MASRKDNQRSRKVYPFARVAPRYAAIGETDTNKMDWKQSVRVASAISENIADLTLVPMTIDGITLNAGDRVLLKSQTTASQNGIYVYGASGLTRAADASDGTLSSGAACFVETGSTNATTMWYLSTNDPITVDTTPLTWVRFFPDSVYNYWQSNYANTIFTTSSVAIRGTQNSITKASDKGTDVFFYVSGSINSKDTSVGTSLFGGDVFISGSTYVDASLLEVTGTVSISGTLQQGYITTATGRDSHAQGGNTISSGDYSHAEGLSTTASGNASHAEGYNTKATFAGAHAEGANCLAAGDYAHAEGSLTTGSIGFAHAEGELSTAAGYASHAEGYFTNTSNYFSHAEGYKTLASGYASHAEGYFTTSSVGYSHAEGNNTVTSGEYSHTEGYKTLASGYASHAEGSRTTGSYDYAHAEGSLSIASGFASHAEGDSTISSNVASHSEGYFTIASAPSAHAEGLVTVASNNGAHAEGEKTLASGYASHSEGYMTTGSNNYAHAEGSFAIASGFASHAEGYFTRASNSYSHAEGWKSLASGYGSHSEGYMTTGSNFYSHGEGYYSVASGQVSHAEGESTTASGYAAHAEGYSTIASGDHSHAEGISTTTSNNGAHAEGESTTASGYGSHAEGYGTIASDKGSHAEGYFTKASNYYSHAEGHGTLASGYASKTSGYYTTASVDYAHARGFRSEAVNLHAYAGGIWTIASGSEGQTVLGRYNTRNNSTSLFVVGNGTGDANANRSDILRVNTNAVEITGSVYATTGFSGSLTRLTDNTPYLIAGSNITLTTGSTGAVTIASTAAASQYFDSTTNGSIYTTGSVAIRGNESSIDSPSDKGTDVYFYVSGSASVSSGASNQKAVFGGDVRVSGSLLMGQVNTAGGINAFSQGYGTIASNQYSHAQGAYTFSGVTYRGGIASGFGSHAEGPFTTASGVGSHSEGYSAVASGETSHAEGAFTTAQGISSHAEGSNTVAVGNYSHAQGRNTIASGSYQSVAGQYNLRNNTSSLFVIGNGSADANASRSDLLRVESGSLGNHRVEVTGSVHATMGFSGSLTRLTDNTPYIVGTGAVSVTTGSTGQLTINVVPGSVTVPGSDTQVIFNDSTSLGADSAFTFNKTTKIVTTREILPETDNIYNLGSSSKRWANVYTGDLHLKNDRGNWTVIEEENYLTIRNNNTGKLFKLVMEPIEDVSDNK